MRSGSLATIFIGFCLSTAFSQSAPVENPGPVQAELLAPVNVRRLEPGATVFARVTLDWKGLDCTLRTGATLEGTVEAADRRTGHGGSRLALSFSKAQCNGSELKPLNLLLAAVAEPPQDWANMPDASLSQPVTFVDPHGNVNPGIGAVGAAQFSLPQMVLRGVIHKFPMSPTVQPGDVIDIKGMKLDIGTGPKNSSVLTTKDRDVALDKFTQFLLVPSDLVYSPAFTNVAPPDAGPTTETVSVEAPPPPSEDDLEVCAPPGCAVDLPVSSLELEGRESTSIATIPLGYEPRPRQTQSDFADEEMLSWLSPSQLLFTFNAHPLIQRAWTPNSSTLRRIVRAVLLDAQDRTVIRAVDWEITDTSQYLWPIDGNRVLVHVGNELRVYGENLEVQRTIKLAGPLSFVRIAPNGNLKAIATLRERHSPDLHAKLRAELENEPEEDVELAILDSGFEAVAHASIAAGMLPPTLLNEGQVTLLSQPNMHYRLALNTWTNKAVTLARFTSSCTPELSSVAPDLLFLVTCGTVGGINEYRVIRADGKVLLRGQLGQHDAGKEVIGDQKAGLFAIKVVHAVSALSPGVEFRATDLESEEVRVYRASDGKRLFAVRVDEPSASHGSYAVSPDGVHLAILTQSQIQLTPLPAQ